MTSDHEGSRTVVDFPPSPSAAVTQTSPTGAPDHGTRSRVKGVIVTVVVAAVVFGLGAIGLRGGNGLGDDPAGKKAPNFTLPLIGGGGNFSLSDLKGRPVVLNVWASWCGPCKKEAPVLAEGYQRWKDRVEFLGLDTQDSKSWAEKFIAEYGIGYRNVFDKAGVVKARYGVTGFPETFFIGRDGRIKAKWVGPLEASDLDQQIALIYP